MVDRFWTEDELITDLHEDLEQEVLYLTSEAENLSELMVSLCFYDSKVRMKDSEVSF